MVSALFDSDPMADSFVQVRGRPLIMLRVLQQNFNGEGGVTHHLNIFNIAPMASSKGRRKYQTKIVSSFHKFPKNMCIFTFPHR